MLTVSAFIGFPILLWNMDKINFFLSGYMDPKLIFMLIILIPVICVIISKYFEYREKSKKRKNKKFR